MNNIKWEDGAVCYAGGRQWKNIGDDAEYLCWDAKTSNSIFGGSEEVEDVLKHNDFQLNEIRTGDYISASELDTEQKFNDAVAVFELFGFKWGEDASIYYFNENSPCNKLVADEEGLFRSYFVDGVGKRKITYSQLMTIGKLKRAMLERDKWNEINDGADRLLFKHASNEDFEKAIDKVKELESEPPSCEASKRNKSKQAYEILKSLDYDYDLVKQRWFKKEWV